MDYNMVAMAEAMSDVYSAYEDLDVFLQHSTEVMETMESIQSLYDEVRELGYCPEVNDKIINFKDLETYTKLSAEKIIKYTATESIGEAVKDAAKKFWSAIREFFQRVIEFFSKVFNTFGNKCREILLHLNAIDFDKPVMTLTKSKFGFILMAGKNVSDFLSSSFQKAGSLYILAPNFRANMMSLAHAHKGVLKFEQDRLLMDEQVEKFENKTLKETGFSIGDIRQMTEIFQTRTKNYSKVGAFFVTIAKEYEAINTLAQSPDEQKDLRAAIRTQGFVYRLLAKIQSISCKQIVAFYKCIGNVVSMNPNPQGQLGYAA